MLPTVAIGPLQVSRLIVGGNPFSGISHQTPERDRAMADHYTAERIKQTLRDCEAQGINTAVLRADAHIWWLLREYWAEGGRIQWIAQTAPEYHDPERNIDQALAHGAAAVYLHGGEVDGLVTSGQTDRVFALVEYIRARGVPAGVAGHSPEVHLELHRQGLPVDFHMVCWYNCGSVHGGQGDVFDPTDPPRAAAAIHVISKPCLAYKVLAAGRRTPAQAFPEVFVALKPTDAAVVGLFTADSPSMVAENVELVARLLQTGR
jgi:hypothetical protein